jgi:tetratricopeptide (TPR) repeat protein
MYNAFCSGIVSGYRGTRFLAFNMSVRVKSADKRAEIRRQLAAARKSGVEQSAGSSLLTPARKQALLLCLLLAILTFALYSPVLGHSFIVSYDDDSYVTNNPHVQAGLTWDTITWALTSTEVSNWHPLTWLSHAFDCEVYGVNPAGHHFTNLLLHVLNVVLVFLLLLRATGATGRSFLVAALFGVHPFNVESVAWVAERKNVLSTLFFLLTLAAYGWYALQPSVKRYLAVAALFILALAAKPMVVTLPCVLLLLDFWPLRRIRGWGESSPQEFTEGEDREAIPNPETPLLAPQVSLSRIILEKLPLLVLSAADSAITMFAQRSYGAMRLVLPLSVRLENAVYAYAMYVGKAFWPARLAVFYPHPGATLTAWQLAPAALFLVVVSALVWWQRARRPYLVTGWLWFLGTLVPVIGLVQVGEQAMADRYAYLPLIGIFLMAVWLAGDWADHKQLRFATRAKIAAPVLAVLAIFTWGQIPYWKSDYDLWQHAVNVTKDNFNAEANLGVTLMSLDRGPEAVSHLQIAARLRPQNPVSHLNLGGALEMNGRTLDAIAQFQTALELNPKPQGLIVAYDALGRLYGRLGNYAQSLVSYRQALRLDPQDTRAQKGLAEIEFSDALRNAAQSPSGPAFLHLGQLLQKAGRVEQARSAYEQALKLDPKLAEARQALDSLEQKQ